MPPRLQRLRQALSGVPPQLYLAAAGVTLAVGSPLARGLPVTSRPVTPPVPAAAPEEAEGALSASVEEAFDAARRGDLETYLSEFTEPLKSQLARLRADKGDGYLRDYVPRTT